MADMQPPFIVDYLLAKFKEEFPNDYTCEEFQPWAAAFMDQHRPSTLQNVEGNYVIKLTSGDEISIAPPFEQGSMQSSGRAVPVTGMETAREIRKAGGPLGRPNG